MDNTKKALLAVFFLVLLWSGVSPHDYFTWFLEVLPALLALLILAVTYGRFRFSNFIYVVICIHSVILMIGGHYTYAEVPLGYWMEALFNFSRNHYDRIGHFAQGFSPALVMREVVIRKEIIRGRGWQFFFITAAVLGFSAFYEFFEWWTALATGEAAEAFLGTQGDVWDTQWDMFMCMIGALSALILMRRLHDRHMNYRLNPRE
jgi:putative membrane protein